MSRDVPYVYTSHTIYGKGDAATVGITFKPTPSLDFDELQNLIQELLDISEEMEREAQ